MNAPNFLRIIFKGLLHGISYVIRGVKTMESDVLNDGV